MGRVDLHNSIDVRRAISPVVSANDTPLVSQIIDRQGFDSLEFIIAIGVITDAASTYTVLVEDGDNPVLSDNVAVPDTELLGTESLASFAQDADNSVLKIGYRGYKRYVRLTLTPANNSGDAPISVIAVLGSPHMAPVE